MACVRGIVDLNLCNAQRTAHEHCTSKSGSFVSYLMLQEPNQEPLLGDQSRPTASAPPKRAIASSSSRAS